MSTPTVYVLCDANCRHEGMTKEQILAVLQQAIDNKTLEGINADAGFVTKLKEMNANKQVKLWLGTQAEYNALTTKEQDTLYLFTDDPTLEALEKAIEENKAEIKDIVEGKKSVGKAKEFEAKEWETCTSFDNEALSEAGTYQIRCSALHLDFGYVWFKGANNKGDTSSNVTAGVCFESEILNDTKWYIYSLHISYSGRLSIYKYTFNNGSYTREIDETSTIEYRKIAN